MSYGAISDEVAEDYRKALEDLTMNSRYEISNLTVIAKENTEHALAISEALKSHIKRVGFIFFIFPFLITCISLWHLSLPINFPLLFRQLTFLLDYTPKEAPCFLCTRFCCEERWYALHPVLRAAAVLDFYGGLRSGGHEREKKDG